MLLTKEGPEIFDADSGPYFLFPTECDYIAFPVHNHFVHGPDQLEYGIDMIVTPQISGQT